MPKTPCAFCGFPFEESELTRADGRWRCAPCGQSAAAGPPAVESVPAPSSSSPAPAPVEKAPSILLFTGQQKFLLPPQAAGPAGLALMAFVGIPFGLILGASYAAVQYYNPFLYFNAIGMGIMAIAVGISVGWLGVAGGTRKGSLLFLFGLLAGVAALYSSWVLFLKLLHEQGWVTHPLAILNAADGLSIKGVWSIKGVMINGLGLKMIWAFEAFFILFLACISSAGSIQEGPFCESCRKSLYPPRLFPRLSVITDPAAVAAKLTSGDLSPILDLKQIPIGSRSQTEFKLWKCRSCQIVQCLDVFAYSRGGANASGVNTPVVEHLTLNTEAYDWLLKHLLAVRGSH